MNECPRCSGALATECVAKEDLPGHECTLVHCEFCRVGWETLWRKKPDGLHEQFTLEFSAAKDAVAYGAFLQRLRDRRVAA